MRREFKVEVHRLAEECGGWIYAHREGASVLILAPSLTASGRSAAFVQAFRWHENEQRHDAA